MINRYAMFVVGLSLAAANSSGMGQEAHSIGLSGPALPAAAPLAVVKSYAAGPIALREIWRTDPAVRDFVGPADYAWDWNTPGDAPGYGPLHR
jgi:hypothetical protein